MSTSVDLPPPPAYGRRSADARKRVRMPVAMLFREPPLRPTRPPPSLCVRRCALQCGATLIGDKSSWGVSP